MLEKNFTSTLSSLRDEFLQKFLFLKKIEINENQASNVWLI